MEARSARWLSGSPRSPSGSAFHGVYSVRTSSAYLPLFAELDVGTLLFVLQVRVFVDPDLVQYDEVRAAAGTWNDVFGIEPHKLVEASGGALAHLKRS